MDYSQLPILSPERHFNECWSFLSKWHKNLSTQHTQNWINQTLIYISLLLFWISANCNSRVLAAPKGSFLCVCVLSISCTIPILPAKIDHCYHQSPATILKKKRNKNTCPLLTDEKVPCKLRQSELELPLLSHFPLHFFAAQMLTPCPSPSMLPHLMPLFTLLPRPGMPFTCL